MMNLKITPEVQMYAIGTVAVLGVLWFIKSKAGDAVEAVADGVSYAAGQVVSSVNPASDQNLIYRGVNAVGDVFDDGSDDDSFSLGSWIYDLTHPEYDPNKPVNNTIPPASAWWNAIKIASPL